MRRTQECKYDDSGRKSRTQSLREKMEALQAKVQELESNPSYSLTTPSASTSWLTPIEEFTDAGMSNALIYPIDLNNWNGNGNDFDPTFSQNMSSPFFQFGFDTHLDFSLSPSPAPFNPTMSRTLDIPMTTDINGQPLIASLGAFSDSSGTSIQDGVSDGLVQECPILTRSREVLELL